VTHNYFNRPRPTPPVSYREWETILGTIRVLLADSSRAFLNAATNFLAGHPDIEIVGTLVISSEVVAMSVKVTPDLVLIDMDMPDVSGLVVLVNLKALASPPRVVIVTDHDQPPYRDLAATLRADGFIAKREFCARVVPTIRALFAVPSAVETWSI